MKTTSVLLLMAGDSVRFHSMVNKTIYEINQKPLYLYSLDVFYAHPAFEKIIIVCHENLLDEVSNSVYSNYDQMKVQIVTGGKTRLESVKKGLVHITTDTVFIHDASRPLITKADLDNLLLKKETYQCGSLYHTLYDTIKKTEKHFVQTISRDTLKAVSTPQFFSKECYQTILDAKDNNLTDELQLFEKDYEIAFVKESRYNLKVTTQEDLEYITYVLTKSENNKIGHSFDFHPFVPNHPLYLGGLLLSNEFGLMGHSDADVVYHAVTESILGALGKGDIGTLFPDTDDQYLNMNSSYFVSSVIALLQKQNYVIENIDVLIYLEKPNLKDVKVKMAQNIKQLTHCNYVNVKATTLEKKGLVGRGEGIACEAVVLIKKIQD